MGVVGESLEKLMNGGILLNEPSVPQGTSAAALLIRRSEVGVEANIVENSQIGCPIRGPGWAAPKDVLLVFCWYVVRSQREFARFDELPAERAPFRGGSLGFVEPRDRLKGPGEDVLVCRADSGW